MSWRDFRFNLRMNAGDEMPLRIVRYKSIEGGITKGVLSEISQLIFCNDRRKRLVGLAFLEALNNTEANQQIHYSFKPVPKFLYLGTRLAPAASMLYRPHAGYSFYASKVPASMSLDALEMRALLACDNADELAKVATACERHNQLGI